MIDIRAARALPDSLPPRRWWVVADFKVVGNGPLLTLPWKEFRSIISPGAIETPVQNGTAQPTPDEKRRKSSKHASVHDDRDAEWSEEFFTKARSMTRVHELKGSSRFRAITVIRPSFWIHDRVGQRYVIEQLSHVSISFLFLFGRRDSLVIAPSASSLLPRHLSYLLIPASTYARLHILIFFPKFHLHVAVSDNKSLLSTLIDFWRERLIRTYIKM